MTEKLTCNQCDATFYTNFQLYQHKSKEHAPIVGVVTNDGAYSNNDAITSQEPTKKRRYQGDGLLKYGKKFRKVYSSGNDDVNSTNIASKKRKYQGDGQLNYGKKHRKLYVSNDEQSDGQDSVPEIITARPKRQKQRPKRKFIPHRDDSEKADEKDVSDHYITDPISMRKRKRSSESSDETIPVNKRYKLNLDKITETRSSTSLVDKLKKELAKYKRYYRLSHAKLNQLRTECDEKISLLSKQLEELREFEGDIELNSLTNAVINNVTINELNEIRNLMSEGRLHQVLRSNKHISA